MACSMSVSSSRPCITSWNESPSRKFFRSSNNASAAKPFAILGFDLVKKLIGLTALVRPGADKMRCALITSQVCCFHRPRACRSYRDQSVSRGANACAFRIDHLHTPARVLMSEDKFVASLKQNKADYFLYWCHYPNPPTNNNNLVPQKVYSTLTLKLVDCGGGNLPNGSPPHIQQRINLATQKNLNAIVNALDANSSTATPPP